MYCLAATPSTGLLCSNAYKVATMPSAVFAIKMFSPRQHAPLLMGCCLVPAMVQEDDDEETSLLHHPPHTEYKNQQHDIHTLAEKTDRSSFHKKRTDLRRFRFFP